MRMPSLKSNCNLKYVNECLHISVFAKCIQVQLSLTPKGVRVGLPCKVPTLKEVTSLGMPTEHSEFSDYVIKMDDDLVIDYPQLFEKISHEFNLKEEMPPILCAIQGGNPPPVASKDSKWWLPESKWPSKVLFPTMCVGWLYAVTPSTGLALAKESKSSNVPFIPLEDHYITGILRTHAGLENKHLGFTNGWKMFECPIVTFLRVELNPYPIVEPIGWGWNAGLKAKLSYVVDMFLLWINSQRP